MSSASPTTDTTLVKRAKMQKVWTGPSSMAWLYSPSRSKGFRLSCSNIPVPNKALRSFPALGGGSPFYVIENRFQWADNLSIAKGRHTLKVGGDVRRIRIEVLKGSSSTTD